MKARGARLRRKAGVGPDQKDEAPPPRHRGQGPGGLQPVLRPEGPVDQAGAPGQSEGQGDRIGGPVRIGEDEQGRRRPLPLGPPAT